MLRSSAKQFRLYLGMLIAAKLEPELRFVREGLHNAKYFVMAGLTGNPEINDAQGMLGILDSRRRGNDA